MNKPSPLSCKLGRRSYASRIKFNNPEDLDELVVVSSKSTSIGYTGGGTQVGAAEERSLNSRQAVGRVDGDWLQHSPTNSQRASENPRDLAPGGFSGRCPSITTAVTGEKARIW